MVSLALPATIVDALIALLGTSGKSGVAWVGMGTAIRVPLLILVPLRVFLMG